jgi:citrate lyase subunit beta/citryl-CoA lyase
LVPANSSIADARLKADAVVLDLEDGVPEAGKDGARASAPETLGRSARPMWVRINDITTTHWTPDLRMVASLSPGLIAGVMLSPASR